MEPVDFDFLAETKSFCEMLTAYWPHLNNRLYRVTFDAKYNLEVLYYDDEGRLVFDKLLELQE